MTGSNRIPSCNRGTGRRRICWEQSSPLVILSRACTVKLLVRRGQLDDDAWQEVEELLFGAPRLHLRDTMPDALRRYAIVYPDGTRTTTLDGPPNLSDEGPVLTFLGGSGSSSETLFELNESLWLWPLPPAEPLELSIEWPLAGIGLTRIELSGASFAAAAAAAQTLWPEPNADQE
jgi:hypothetical protein